MDGRSEAGSKPRRATIPIPEAASLREKVDTRVVPKFTIKNSPAEYSLLENIGNHYWVRMDDRSEA